MKLTLRIWRQPAPDAPGRLVAYDLDGLEPDLSFLEMLDVLNERLILAGDEPVAFDHDCREGICGSCALVVDGVAHGPRRATTVCQLYLRDLTDGATITVEPWRAAAFPVVKDLVTDRGALDRIIEAGGFVTVSAGSAPDANTIPVPKDAADLAFEAASCIGCGACVAACPNASAMLFLAAKVSQLALLPQGQPERAHRVLAMTEAMERERFGACSNHYECEAVCPQEISVRFIARLNREYARAALTSEELAAPAPHPEYRE